eukprot:gene11316-11466_t
MDEQQYQQLQVLLDVLRHEELADFITTATGAARLGAAALGKAGTGRHNSIQGPSPYGMQTSSSTGHQLLGSALSNVGGWQGRSRAAGCLLDLPGFDLFGAATDLGSSSSVTRRQASGYRSTPTDLNGLRFATLLPTGHILTKIAEDLQRKHEFEAALLAGRATRPTDILEQQQHTWRTDTIYAPFNASAHEPFVAAPFEAPDHDVEQIWKQGRKAAMEAVMGQAHLAVHDSPLSHMFMLAPGVPVVPRFLPPPPTPQAAELRGPTASRRGSGSRRPSTRGTASRADSSGIDSPGPTAAGEGGGGGGGGGGMIGGTVPAAAMARTPRLVTGGSGGYLSSSDTSMVPRPPQQLQTAMLLSRQWSSHARDPSSFIGELRGDVSLAGGSVRSSGTVPQFARDALTVLDKTPSTSRPVSGSSIARTSLPWEQLQAPGKLKGMPVMAGAEHGGDSTITAASSGRLSPGAPYGNNSMAGAHSAAAATLLASSLQHHSGTTASGMTSRPGSAVPQLALSRLGSMHSGGSGVCPGSSRPGTAGNTYRPASPGAIARPVSAMNTSRLATAAGAANSASSAD